MLFWGRSKPEKAFALRTPIWKMILSQFVGTMPVMLEAAGRGQGGTEEKKEYHL